MEAEGADYLGVGAAIVSAIMAQRDIGGAARSLAEILKAHL